ncbi:MAG: flippase-like domain-containing protein [Cryobacterium sp.]|nr:flippase-like domain-containing protein [Oligoflexia bacterium]
MSGNTGTQLNILGKTVSLRSLSLNVLKVLFVVLVFWWLAKKNLISVSAFMGGLKNWPQILVGVFCLLLSAFLAAFRWGILLRAQGIKIRNSRLLQLQFIGNFFNVALPGAVSGDFVKAFYIAHESPGNRGRAFGSILFDRLVGLTALVAVSVTALLLEMRHFIGSPILAGVKAFVMTSGAAVVVFYAYLFLMHENADPVLQFLQAFERRNAKFGSLVRIYLGVRVYHSERRLVVRAFLVAFLIQSLSAYACLCFARALGEWQIPANGLLVVTPLGLLVTAVPVLPGGVGTGHAAFSFFYHLLGSDRGADIFSYFVLIQLCIGAVGGLVYLKFKKGEPSPLV